jgi:hypothetical protein
MEIRWLKQQINLKNKMINFDKKKDEYSSRKNRDNENDFGN